MGGGGAGIIFNPVWAQRWPVPVNSKKAAATAAISKPNLRAHGDFILSPSIGNLRCAAKFTNCLCWHFRCAAFDYNRSGRRSNHKLGVNHNLAPQRMYFNWSRNHTLANDLADSVTGNMDGTKWRVEELRRGNIVEAP
jgi:hypothetical protein